MAIDERSRHTLHARLEEILGSDEAATLMEHLPPVGWADVATKRDLDALQVATKRDMDALQVATKRDLDAQHGSLRASIDALGTQLRTEMELMEQRIKVDVRTQTLSTERHFVTWLLGANLTLAGLAFAAAKLF